MKGRAGTRAVNWDNRHSKSAERAPHGHSISIAAASRFSRRNVSRRKKRRRVTFAKKRGCIIASPKHRVLAILRRGELNLSANDSRRETRLFQTHKRPGRQLIPSAVRQIAKRICNAERERETFARKDKREARGFQYPLESP